MKTVGEILREVREEKKVALEEAIKATKIKREFLEAIERDDFRKIGSAVSIRGFIKNYAEFLGLSSQFVLAVFKRDFVREKEPPAVFLKQNFTWTPKLTLVVVVIIFAFLVSFYLAWQYFSLISTPYR